MNPPENPAAKHPHNDLTVEERTKTVEEAIDLMVEESIQKIQDAVDEVIEK